MINHGILIHKPRAKTGIAILNVFLAESIINNLPQSEVSNTKKTYLYGLVRANLQEPLEKIRKKTQLTSRITLKHIESSEK